MSVKFLYCPKCKELRVKPWYSIRDSCTRCRGDVRVIEVPRTIWSYTVYGLTVVIFVAVYLNTRSDDSFYLYTAIILLISLAVIQLREVVRGERYARSKIKVTKSDLAKMRRKGWR
jgi:hypothetical protein